MYSKQILKPSEARDQVLTYKPRAFAAVVPEQVKPFSRAAEQNAPPKEFEINALVAQSTGLQDMEKKNYDEKVKEEVLLRLKTIEEKAHGEAYKLGLQEGREKALQETRAAVEETLSRFASIMESLTRIKSDLVVNNEAGLVETVFHMAKALAFKAIQEDPSIIKEVLTKALENAQHDEELTLRIHPKDAKFLEAMKGVGGNPLEKVKNVRIEAEERVEPGGCVLETNYGVIDATIEQRVQKLWKTIEEKIPKSAEEK